MICASKRFTRLAPETRTVSVVQSLIVHHRRNVRVRHCKRIAAVAAAAAAAVGVVAFAKWKTTCRVLLSSLLVLPCSHLFLPLVFPSASSAKLWVSPTPSLSRACSAALLAARQTRRRPRAVCMCGPLSTRIHHAFLHHFLHALNSLPSSLQRTSLALSSLLRALPGRRLLFLELFLLLLDLLARSEHSLLSLAPPEPSLLSRSS